MPNRVKLFVVVCLLIYVLTLNAQINIVLHAIATPTNIPTSSNTALANDNGAYHIQELNEDYSFNMPENGIYPTFTDVSLVAKTPASNFMFLPTRTEFPYEISPYQRKQLIASKTQSGKITVIYGNTSSLKDDSGFSIRLIPAGFGTEGRLRNAFVVALKNFSEELDIMQEPIINMVRFNGNSYNPLGIQAVFSSDNKEFSGLTVYECGSWLMEINIHNFKSTLDGFYQFHNKLVMMMNPSQLTAIKPLYVRPNIDFDKEALKDTIVTSALWASAMKKLDWANDNISQKERAAGFPDMYLEMHVAALSEYLAVQAQKSSLNKSTTIKKLYYDLSALRNAGFLREYIMEQYQHLMIVPNHIHLDFTAYQQWKKGKDLQADIRKKWYTISYRNLPY